MAASKEYTEWHLVRLKGWVRGTERDDRGKFETRPIPSGAAMSVTWKEECNGYGPVYSSHAGEVIHNQVEADLLQRQFGLPPKYL